MAKSNCFSLSIDNYIITPSFQINSLGVILDSTLSFETHVNNVTRSAYFYLCNISSLLPFFTPNTTAILVHIVGTSNIDYCNFLLFGSPQKLQLVQNSAAHIIARTLISLLFFTIQTGFLLNTVQNTRFSLSLFSLHNLGPSYIYSIYIYIYI